MRPRLEREPGRPARPSGRAPHAVLERPLLRAIVLAGLAVSLQLAAARAATSSAIFGGRTFVVPTGSGAYALRVADLNGDGLPDLVTGSSGPFVSVHLGVGIGTFGPRQDYATSSRTHALAVVDLDGDGDLDLVATNVAAGSVSVLLGAGDGSFGARADFPTGDSPSAIAVDDLNEDGRADLAVANAGSNSVSVLLGTGAGAFGDQVQMGTGTLPVSLASADFDGDAHRDLVVVNQSSNTVSVLLGAGDGTFQAPATFTTLGYPTQVLVGDLDGDAALDLVLAHENTAVVSVMLGHGDGSFDPAAPGVPASSGMPAGSPTGELPRSESVFLDPAETAMAMADLDEDGKLDLAVTYRRYLVNPVAWYHGVMFLRGHGDGTFELGLAFGTKSSMDVTIADLDADGRADMAVASGTEEVRGFLAPFGEKSDVGVAPGLLAMAIGDLNGDGRVDAVAAGAWTYASVGVLIGETDGTFRLLRGFQPWGSPTALALGDVNEDGRLDLAIALAPHSVSLQFGDGTGDFGGSSEIALAAMPTGVAIRDMNGDHRLDLVVTMAGASPDAQGSVGVLIGGGDGTFVQKPAVATGVSPSALAIGDVDRDGKRDVVVTNSGSNTFSLVRGRGDGTLGWRSDFATGLAPGALALEDLNRDLALDVVVANQGSNTVSVFLGDGHGGFDGRTDMATGGRPRGLVLGNPSATNNIDLVVTKPDFDCVSVMLGNGDGTFGPGTDYATGSEPTVAAVHDVTGDGKPDLIVADWLDGWLSVIHRIGGAGPQATPTFLVSWGEEGAGHGQLASPMDIALDPDGNVLVVDFDPPSVVKFTNQGAILAEWPVGLVGEPLMLSALAVGPGGEVYVADDFGGRVLILGPNGAPAGQWGSEGSGDGQFRGIGGLAVDRDGTVYAADRLNARIQKFTSSGAYLGQWGTEGIGDGRFRHPTRIAIGPDRSIFVLDFGNTRVQKFTPEGVFLAKWGSMGSGVGQFGYPVGIAVDAVGTVFVADERNARVTKFTSDGDFVAHWGAHGTAEGEFWWMCGVAVDVAGFVYEAETWPTRVQKFGYTYVADAPGEKTLDASPLAAYPNPTRGPVRLRFATSRAGPVSIEILDVAGRRVRQWRWPNLEAGVHHVDWDGAGADELVAPPGLVFCRLISGGRSVTRKIVRLHP
jgi:hypothetical protein